MLDKILDFIAPHHCYNCQKTGSILCSCCKNNILQTLKSNLNLTSQLKNNQVVYLEDGDGTLKKLIYYYKLNSVRALSKIFAEIIYETLNFKESLFIVPIPTIKRSQCRRGFGHMEDIGQELARISGWQYAPVLVNSSKLAQKDLKSKQRHDNINQHLQLKPDVKMYSNKTYLIIDDITTTGATLERARFVLSLAGAKKIICLALVHK
ncbi:MAG: phosphoribosyltransferase family protein [Candidatus Saccharibacteria bacterium]|nr:phosphoribosyltransferase family protein [Candidatus Saccharibacteria bacterium]